MNARTSRCASACASARERCERRLDGGDALVAGADDGAEPPARTSVAARVPVARNDWRRARQAPPSSAGYESAAIALLQPKRLQHQPRGVGLAELARVAARVAEGRGRGSRLAGRTGHVRRLSLQRREAAEDGVDGFVDPVGRTAAARARSPARSASSRTGSSIAVGKHAAFFEPDDEEMRTAGVAGLLKPAGVEVTGTRTLRARPAATRRARG